MPIWKEIESKGLKWFVGSDGSIKTPAHSHEYTRTRNGKSQKFIATFKERTLAQCKTANGYLEVSAKKNGARVKHLVHRLIGMAFVPGYKDDLTINHIDGNKLNNKVENLEWVTLSKNSELEWKTGLVNLRGDSHPNSKLTSRQVRHIRVLLNMGAPAHSLSVVAGVSSATIEHIKQGRRWASVAG